MASFKAKVHILDNCGATKARCVKIYGGFRRKKAVLGDIIQINVKRYKHQQKINRKELYFGLIINLRNKTKRLDGSFLKFDKTGVLVFNKQNKFMGTRLYSVVPNEIRRGLNTDKLKQIIPYITNII